MWKSLLSDDDETLASFAKICAIGPDIEKDDINPHVEYSSNAPSHCRVTIGANLSGYCSNPGCKINGKYVYMQVGKEEYLVRNFQYCVPHKCPECKADVEVRDWGFSRCAFKVLGRKTQGTKVERPWRRADDHYYKISMDDLGPAEYETVKVLYLGPKDTFPNEDDL